MSSAEQLVQSLTRFKDSLANGVGETEEERPFERSAIVSTKLNILFVEVRKHFRNTIAEHLQSNGHIYSNLHDAESILDLLEVVVSEYGDVFCSTPESGDWNKFLSTSNSAVETPVKKKPRLDIKESPLNILRYLIYCCYNIVFEPLLNGSLFCKCAAVCRKCLESLQFKHDEAFKNLIDEILLLVSEACEALSLFRTWSGARSYVDFDISFKAFDVSSIYPNCVLVTRFQYCIDELLRFSFVILERFWDSFLDIESSWSENLLRIFQTCLLHSSLQTKTVVEKNLNQLVTLSKPCLKFSCEDLTKFLKSVSLYCIKCDDLLPESALRKRILDDLCSLTSLLSKPITLEYFIKQLFEFLNSPDCLDKLCCDSILGVADFVLTCAFPGKLADVMGGQLDFDKVSLEYSSFEQLAIRISNFKTSQQISLALNNNEKSKLLFVVAVFTNVKVSKDESVDNSLKRLLESVLNKIDMKFSVSQLSVNSCGHSLAQFLQTIDTTLRCLLMVGLKEPVYLEVLSSELLFDCVSAVKKLFFQCSSFSDVELNLGLMIVEKFLLLTFPLDLDTSLLKDICWMASLSFKWFDSKLDWKELEPFRKQPGCLKVLECVKKCLEKSDCADTICVTSAAINCLLFQHFQTKSLSAILLVNFKNSLQQEDVQLKVIQHFPATVAVLLKSEEKLADHILINQFLPLVSKVVPFQTICQLVCTFKLILSSNKMNLNEVKNAFEIDAVDCFLTVPNAPKVSSAEGMSPTLWQNFVVPLLNKLKLSQTISVDEFAELLCEVVPLTRSYEELLPYFVPGMIHSLEINDKYLEVLECIVRMDSLDCQQTDSLWKFLLTFFREVEARNEDNVFEFHVNKVKLLGFLLRIIDINSERTCVQMFVNESLKALIEYLFSNHPIVKNTACDQLKRSCDKSETFKLGDCFAKYKEDICDTWVAIVALKFEALCKTKSQNNDSKNLSESDLNDTNLEFVSQLIFLCQVFEIDPSPIIVRDISPLIVPQLFLVSAQLAFVYCKEIGTELMKEEVDSFMSTILVPVVALLLSHGCEDPKSRFQDLFPKIFDNWNNFILSKLIPISFALAANIGDRPEKVLEIGFPYLAEIDFNFQDNVKKLSAKSGCLEISKLYLGYRLLAIMTNFKTVLLSSSAGKATKKRRLKSTVKLIQFLGKDLVSLNCLKLLDLLRLIPKLKYDNYCMFMMEAYDVFAQHLHEADLQGLASQIAYDIITVRDEKPSEVDALLKTLRASFSKHLTAFYFLPVCQDDTQKVEESITRIEDVSLHLDVVVTGLKEDTIETKFFVLQNFFTILKNNPDIASFFVDLDNLPEENQLITFVRMLVLQFNTDHEPVQQLVAKILGYIGAIDSSKIIDLRVLASKSEFKSECSTETFEFRHKLLTMLVQSLSSSSNSEPRMIDCCAYSTQELLKVFQCSPASNSVSGQKLWDSFDEETKCFLSPYLKSKYSYNYRSSSNSDYVKFYMDESVTTYKQWICKLVKHLATFVSDSKAQAVFSACDAVLNYNVDIATFLLPVIVIKLISENNESCKSLVIQEFLKVLRDVCSPKSRPFAKVCCQTVFLTLETISNYERSTRSEKLISNSRRIDSSTEHNGDILLKCDLLSEFLSRIMSNTIAKAAFACKAYARAVFYAEEHLHKLDDPDSELSLMQKCFLELNEPDGVKGVNEIRTRKLTSMEKVLNYKSQNRMNEALVCCSTAISENLSHAMIKEYLACFLAIGQTDSAKYHALGYLNESNPSNVVAPMCMEACWQLSDWTKLSELLANHGEANGAQLKHDWQVDFSRCVSSLSDQNWESLEKNLKLTRSGQINCVTAATMDYSNAYLRAYDAISKLQMVSSVEIVSDLLKNRSQLNIESVEKVCNQLELRQKVLQPSFSVLEPERQLYRSLLHIVKDVLSRSESEVKDQIILSLLDTRTRNSWLETSKAARGIGYYDTALKGLQKSFSDSEMNAENILEHSLLLKSKGNDYEGLMLLQKFIADHNLKTVASVREMPSANRRKLISKIYLQIGKFMEETRWVESNKIFSIYKSSIDIWPEQEDSYYCVGAYYEVVLHSWQSSEMKQDSILPKIHHFYVHTLKYGNKYIFQALPRLLSLWLDQGSKLHTLQQELEKGVSCAQSQVAEKGKHSEQFVNLLTRNVQEMNNFMLQVLRDGTIAPYQFFTAFSQLISRICHPLESVFEVLKMILVSVIKEYPQQTLWLSVAVRNSTLKLRYERCRRIFEEAKKDAVFAKQYQASNSLCYLLKDLCEKNPSVPIQEMNFSLKQHCSKLSKLLESSAFSEIIIPSMDSLTATIPETKQRNWNPFRNDKVFIHNFEDKVDILMSMQRPKKFVVIGSDGRQYPMMAKPKDDMRKDYRVLECNVIMNQFLQRDAEARKRHLHIRTYAVIALDKENGLVEWIKNTQAFRPICYRLYREKNQGLTPREIKNMQPPRNASSETFLNLYEQTLIPKHSPPVFKEWFVRTFTNPTSWFLARLAYCRTAAVMSIVGYIWGLGDRHGENILLDALNGDCVHVDFNCLFNKGDDLEFPECVPFRLTHNMLSAMGPLKQEGFFRQSCQVTLRLFRQKSDALLSILRPFLHDPITEFDKKQRGKHKSSSSSRPDVYSASMLSEVNPRAQEMISRIGERLQGKIRVRGTKDFRSLPLSVEGQVESLIEEATNVENLSRMYLGWAAFL